MVGGDRARLLRQLRNSGCPVGPPNVHVVYFFTGPHSDGATERVTLTMKILGLADTTTTPRMHVARLSSEPRDPRAQPSTKCSPNPRVPRCLGLRRSVCASAIWRCPATLRWSRTTGASGRSSPPKSSICRADPGVCDKARGGAAHGPKRLEGDLWEKRRVEDASWSRSSA